MEKLTPEKIKEHVSQLNAEMKIFGAPFGLGEIVYNELRSEKEVVVEIERLQFEDRYFSPPILGFRYRFMALDYPYNDEDLYSLGLPKLSPKQIRKERISHTGEQVSFDGKYPCMLTTRTGYEWEELKKFLPI